MTWLIPALWLALFAGLFVFPPIFAGRHASHNAGRIIMPEGVIAPSGSTIAYVLVQERGEFRLHKLCALAAGVPFLFIPPEPITLMIQPLAMLMADQFTRKLEAIDFAGHGAEILAAEAQGDKQYREQEIARMMGDRDKRGDDVIAKLARWQWLARIVYTLGRF